MGNGLPDWFSFGGLEPDFLVGQRIWIRVQPHQYMLMAEETSDGAYVITSLDALTPS